ncbi:MAG: SEC-C metal-binding domain-containing protein, partial [Mucinivorans sp.]
CYMEKRTTTPKELTDQIKSFCSEILTDVQPIYIPIQPIENGQYGECYKNVQNAINAMGGKRILGWNIWWWANILLEAEAHAIEEIKQHSSGNTVALPGELVERYMWLLSIFKTKVGRNDPCPCQSGLKYKKCCGQ